MHRRLTLCSAIVALSACATHLPPAPTVLPVSTAPDSAVYSLDVSPQSADTATADAIVLNDLAAASPDEKVVPAFDGERVRWDIDVETYSSHPRVQYYLSYFDGLARSRMEVFLHRGARYESMIRRRFEAEGLPGDLGYLALIESGYSNEAVSRAYAVGMWQFMRATGRGYGLRVDSWVDERRDPVKATDAAARHLHDLRVRFGSLYLAAAAYNAGAGKVSRSLGKLQWDVPAEPLTEEAVADSVAVDEDSTIVTADTAAEDSTDSAPDPNDVTSDAAFFRLASNDLLAAETQDYVPKLIASALIAKAPERYGFSADTAEEFAYDSIVVTDVTGLDVIARLADTDLDKIRELNPQYLRLATPPRSVSVVRLPPGTGATVAERYADLRPSQRIRFITYRVPATQRLTAIAARYHLPVAEVRAANPKLKTSRPRKGTVLIIPAVAAPSALAMRATGEVGSASRRTLHGRIHRVRRGETLSGIARHYRVSVRALSHANSLASRNTIRAGMRLRIPR